MSFPNSNFNKLEYSGFITVSEEVAGEIEFLVEASKCSLDMKSCEKYNNVKIQSMCDRFMEKNTFYSSALASIHPQLKCPIKPGVYTLNEAAIDLSLISVIPLDGYVWVVTFKLLQAEKTKKMKKVVLCLNSETKIIRSSDKRPPAEN